MNLNHHTSIGGTLILILVLISAGSGPALAAGEPTIAPEIQRLIDEEGIEAAEARYQELSQSASLDIFVESMDLQELYVTYYQAGKQDAADAVSAMITDLGMKMTTAMMNQGIPGLAQQMASMPGMGQQMVAEQREAEQQAKEQQKQKRQVEQRLQEEKMAKQRGESRKDLSRFFGFYGEPGASDLGRTIFVKESCDGYLVSGPMWADISLWWMYSASEFVFTYSLNETDFRMEFEADGAGKVVRMRHNIDGVKSPLEWKQALTKDWSKCANRRY